MKKSNKILLISLLVALLILIFLVIIVMNVLKDNEKTEQENETLYEIIPIGYFKIEDDLNKAKEDKVLAISDNEKDKEKGMLSEEVYGNQFIWISVENIEKYTIQEYSKYAGYQHVPIELEEAARQSIVSDSDVEIYKKMCESVKAYGGFYLSRYKAGEEKGKVVVKKGATIYHDTDWKTAKQIARQFSTENKMIGYTSSLCYEKQYENIINQSQKSMWNLQEENTFDEWIIGNRNQRVTTMNIESKNLSSRPALETEPSIGFRIMMFKNIE